MPTTVFRIALCISLVLCTAGLAWRVAGWFRTRIGPDARGIGAFRRLVAVKLEVLRSLFGRRGGKVLGALVLDALLQRRLFRRAKVRWAAHMLILWGFFGLFLLHALDEIVTAKLFRDYQSTLDPWLFLRNLLGGLVIAGVVVLFIARRFDRGPVATIRSARDRVFVALLALALLTGFLVESAKITSSRAFDRMAAEWAGDDPDELLALRHFWAAEFGVVFDGLGPPPDPATLDVGRALHVDNCAVCHSPVRTSAFVSYPISRVFAPLAVPLDAGHTDVWLYWIHVAACFLGIVLLPWTRFFHAVADPVSLVLNGAASPDTPPAVRVSRRALASDACIRCGLCDARCSVAPIARFLGNPLLLPSHKLSIAQTIGTGALVRGPDLDAARQAVVGAYACTTCGRCTQRCPVGIDLEDLWDATRADLAASGEPPVPHWIGTRSAVAWAEALPPSSGVVAGTGPLSSNLATFSRCVQCQTCTNVCPVVAHSLDPSIGVDLTPHKVMNLIRLGMVELALGSRMVRDCATCYQCQQNCPAGVRVTDVICELRACATHRLADVREGRRPT